MFSTWFLPNYASEEKKSVSQEIFSESGSVLDQGLRMDRTWFVQYGVIMRLRCLAVLKTLKQIFLIGVGIKKEAFFHTASKSRLEVLLLYIGDVFWLHAGIPWPWKPSLRHFHCICRCLSSKDMTSFRFSRNGGIITRSIQDVWLSSKKMKLWKLHEL